MDYPEPLVIPPHTPPHQQTFILLHGRGSSGNKFGPALLQEPVHLLANSIPNGTATTLALTFPHARFAFPTACLRRATIYRRALTRQWFNNWKLGPPATAREELQAPGLCETTEYIHDLWRREIGTVPGGATNVIVGGLSQGCAATLVVLLLWEGEHIGAMVEMCGWLPFSARLSEHMSEEDETWRQDDEFNPFDINEDSSLILDPSTRAIAWLREELGLVNEAGSKTEQLGSKDTPIFLGHVMEDAKISIILGRQSAFCLRSLGIDIIRKEYELLGHRYSGDLLRDLIHFVKHRLA